MVTFTDSAIEKLRELAGKENDRGIRIFVAAGG
jgi:Fe-S cluster assembly iron-binding protein IscA